MVGYNSITKEFYIIGGRDSATAFVDEYYTISHNLQIQSNSFPYHWNTFDAQGYSQSNQKLYYIPSIQDIMNIYEFDMTNQVNATIGPVVNRHKNGYGPCITVNDDDVNNIKIYVIGTPLDSFDRRVSEYNVDTKWDVIGYMQYARFLASCNYYNGNLYVIGGYSNDILNTIHKYNGNNFADINARMNQHVYKHRSVLIPDTGQIYIIGGKAYSGQRTNKVDILDTSDDSIISGPSLNIGRALHAAIHAEGTIYVFGGRTDNANAISSIETLVVSTNGPTRNPTTFPTADPSSNPSYTPTERPIEIPTKTPIKVPTETPTATPSLNPSRIPSNIPSVNPATNLSQISSYPPTQNPTLNPFTKTVSNSTSIPTMNIMDNATDAATLLPSVSPKITGEQDQQGMLISMINGVFNFAGSYQ